MTIRLETYFTVYNTCVVIVAYSMLFNTFISSVNSSTARSQPAIKCVECSKFTVAKGLSRNEKPTEVEPNKFLTSLFTTQQTRLNGNKKTRLIKKEILKYSAKTENINQLKNYNNDTNPVSSLSAVVLSGARRLQDRQLQPLDPEFGAFYIQRKLWYIPLYFSVGFCLYMWSLIIKSLSRHRVLYPPPPPPPGVIIGR